MSRIADEWAWIFGLSQILHWMISLSLCFLSRFEALIFVMWKPWFCKSGIHHQGMQCFSMVLNSLLLCPSLEFLMRPCHTWWYDFRLHISSCCIKCGILHQTSSSVMLSTLQDSLQHHIINFERVAFIRHECKIHVATFLVLYLLLQAWLWITRQYKMVSKSNQGHNYFPCDLFNTDIYHPQPKNLCSLLNLERLSYFEHIL